METRRLVCCAVIFLGLVGGGVAQGQQPAVQPFNCGLFCLYSAFQYYGNAIEPATLLQPKYISARSGSTVGDLVRAANDFGFRALPLKNLSTRTALRCPYPLIISVRSTPSASAPNHYWVILPRKEGPSVVLDALHGRAVNPEQLSRGHWSGVGLVISRDPVNTGRVFVWDYVLVGALGMVVLAIGEILRRHMKRTSAGPRPLASMATLARIVAIVTLSFVAAVGYHGATGAGSFLNDAATLDEIQNRHLADLLPLVTADGLEAARRSGAVVVDARIAPDYAHGHVPSAINLPPGSSPEQCAQALAAYPREVRIVVYCQSSGCPYATKVAVALRAAGYKNIAYYRAGWLDWKGRKES